MSEKKECVRCRRSIDAAARVCPYCNRDQYVAREPDTRPATVPLTPLESPPPPARSATGKGDRTWSTRALIIAAVVALLMASFAVGGLVYGLGRRGKSSRSENERPLQIAESASRADREFPQLILVAEGDPTSTIGRSITSAPLPDPDHKLPEEFQRSDATALPSAEYSRIIEESRKREPEQQAPQPASVDPRTVTAQQPPAVYAAPTRSIPETRQPETTERPQEPAQIEPPGRPQAMEPRPRRAVRTEPVPIYQPLPRVKDRREEIEESGTLRFRLNIGADGRVKEIRVLETMPQMTGKMIAAIQKWRFKPATENGVPVEGTFMVDISFKAPE